MTWTKIPNDLLLRVATIEGAAARVFLAIAMHANEAGESWPSVPRIASLTGLSRRSVQYAVRQLDEAGVLDLREERGRSNRYSLGGATDCTPETGGVQQTAPPPVQQVAPGGATHCTPPVQQVAPELDIGNKKKRARVFTKPTLEAVQAYCQERRNDVDPQRWYAYYESNGWRVGRNPMKDWKAAIHTWERNGYSNGNGNGKPRTPTTAPAIFHADGSITYGDAAP